MTSSFNLSYDDFMLYKTQETELPKELASYVNKLKLIQLKNKKGYGNWRKTEKTKTSWLVTKKITQNADEHLISNYRGILNRISDSNFDEMMEELFNLDIETEENLKVLVNLIFEKAIIEENYASMYAKMALKLYPKYVEADDTKIYFRDIFLLKCEHVFLESIDINNEDELKDCELKSKFEITGLMIFIGQLYNHGLLTNKIIYNCLINLMLKITEDKLFAIDNICKLIIIIGEKFSKSCPSDFAKILKRLEIIKDTLDSKKSKFAIMDILEKKY